MRHSIDYFFPRVDACTARECRETLNMLLGREDRGGFPGAQPVTLSRHDLAEMQSRPHEFLMGEKSDGLRCMLVIPIRPSYPQRQMGTSAYLVDRRSTVYALPRLLPPSPSKGAPDGASFPPPSQHGTDETRVGGVVLDCELAMVRFGGDSGMAGGRQHQHQHQQQDDEEPQLIVFDMLACDGQTRLHLGYESRREGLALASEDCVVVEGQSHWCLHARTLGLRVHLKSMYGVEHIKAVSDGNAEDQSRRRCDGLIFMRRNAAYTPGTDPNIYKWKSLWNTTVDFKLVMTDAATAATTTMMRTTTLPLSPGVPPRTTNAYRGGSDGKPAVSRASKYARSGGAVDLQLFAFHGSAEHCYHAPLRLNAEERQAMQRYRKPVNGDIIECRFDSRQQAWRPVLRADGEFLVRTDKIHANHISVVTRTMLAIRECIEHADLLESLLPAPGSGKVIESSDFDKVGEDSR